MTFVMLETLGHYLPGMDRFILELITNSSLSVEVVTVELTMWLMSFPLISLRSLKIVLQ